MNNMTIEVGFLSGTNIREAILEAKQKAISLDVMIEFNFNGVIVLVGSGTNVERAISSYHLDLSKLGY